MCKVSVPGKKIFTYTHYVMTSKLKKSKALQFDQKTKPYILAAFRDVKNPTPQNIAVSL